VRFIEYPHDSVLSDYLIVELLIGLTSQYSTGDELIV